MKDNCDVKILECSIPPIATFFHVDIPLTILYGDTNTHPWIFSNYIQLYSIHNMEEFNPCFIDFHHSFNGAFRFLELSTCPWILFERISRKDVINRWPSVLEFVKEKIDENRYIGITVEASKIQNYGNLAIHNLFIYGYDNKKEVLYTADHFRNGQFKFEEVKYAEFAESVGYSYDLDLNWGNLEGVCLFSKIKREHKNIYKLDIGKIIHDMKSYLVLEGWAYKNDEYFLYGIDCYDNLIKYYSLALEGKWYCDLKGIYTEICHKIMMILRLEFLQNNGYAMEDFVERFTKIRDKLVIVFNILMKYNLTYKKEDLEYCIENLRNVKTEETKLFQEVIEKLVAGVKGNEI